MSRLATLYLKPREDQRVRAGHPWVFSNEVDVGRSPLGDFMPGQSVVVANHVGRAVGSATVSPHSLICARLISRRAGVALDARLVAERLGHADALRRRLVAGDCYRAVFGESDALPGLVVDRHGAVVVVQIGTAAMEGIRDDVVAAIRKRFEPAAIVLRNDAPGREAEGLPRYVEVAHGDLPDACEVRENAARFLIDPIAGQKTGWYYDHRENRARLAGLAGGASVLDGFSYRGAWGIQAACAGAERVTCLDSAADAIDAARENAARNDVASRVEVERCDVLEALRDFSNAGRRFDVVALDPPAYIRRRKDLKQGLVAYRRLARRGIRVVGENGVLMMASCSSHLRREQLLSVVQRAASDAGRRARVFAQGHQGPDHPVHPAMPESEYLKALFVHVR